MLTKDQFNKTKIYIKTNARPLDKALFEFEFNNGSSKTVLEELKTYQNDDGGFGNALEPDIRIKESSIIATTVALQYVNELNLSKTNEMIKKAINYIIKEIKEFPKDFSLKYFWYSIPKTKYQEMRAPWWIVKKYKPPEVKNWPNPNVEVISYLLKYSQYVKNSLIDDLIDDLNNYLTQVPKFTGYFYYRFLCFKRLMPNVNTKLLKEIVSMFDKSVIDNEFLDEKEFDELKIQWFVTEKSSYLNKKYPDRIKILLENEIKNLGNDGGSHPKWKWGDTEIWKEVEKEWTGKCTLGLLKTLKYCKFL